MQGSSLKRSACKGALKQQDERYGLNFTAQRDNKGDAAEKSHKDNFTMFVQRVKRQKPRETRAGVEFVLFLIIEYEVS